MGEAPAAEVVQLAYRPACGTHLTMGNLIGVILQYTINKQAQCNYGARLGAPNRITGLGT